MRWLALAIVLAAALRADARPVRDDDFIHDDVFDDRFVPRRLKKRPSTKPRKPPPPPCKPNTEFKQFMACQFKGWSLEILHEVPAAKLLTIRAPGEHARKQLALYLLVDKNWVRAGVYAELNDSTDLLSFKQIDGAYRVDLGFTNHTWVTSDDITSQPAMLRRTHTYICELENAACRSVQSSCDVLVRGRTIATFRGTVKWNGKDLKVRGDDRNTNRYCVKPPPIMMETD